MNILRWKRKSKKKIKFKTILLFVFSLIMSTLAWFAYSKVLNSTLNIHLSSWDMEYYIGEDKKTNPIGIEIPTIYPTMPTQIVQIDIKNNGETLVDIDYYLESFSIAGTSYELLYEGQTNTTQNYIILTPSVHETTAAGDEIYKGVITNDLSKFPFTIEVEHSAQIEAESEGYLTVTVDWLGDNNDLDSEWGYIANTASAISMDLRIESYQVDPEDDGEITTIMPSTTLTTPYLPTGFSRVPGTTLETGLAIKDGSGNEYVWVEVPKSASIYTNTGIGKTSLSATDITNIRTDLKTYTGAYKSDTYSDTFFLYQAVGIAREDYEALEQKMLESIYKNGGFYIGRYETGVLNAPRTTSGNLTQTPVIKPNAYPYNFITCSQAQGLASGMASGEYTSSLMFGLQWDLVLKYLETKGTSQADLKTDSTVWGNYRNNMFYVADSRSGYNLRNDTTTQLMGWTEGKYDKATESSILLKTGASSIFSKQNIRDIAGNLFEYTLEYTANSTLPSSARGGNYYSDGTDTKASSRGAYSTTYVGADVGFRVAIY